MTTKNDSGATLWLNRSAKSVLSCFVIFLLACMLCALASPAAYGQNNNSQLRTVHGTVVDKNDNPAPTSIVFLLNSKTQAVRSYFADEKGEYHFAGLDPNVDYEIHAERGNMTSSTRTISSFDSRRDIDMTLKLAHQKQKGSNTPEAGDKT